jgi:glucokinase
MMILGSVAGDFALSFGARGGVFLAGGLTQGMTEFFGTPLFRARFESKGRLSPFLQAIPTKLVTRVNAAFLGLAHVAMKFLAAELAT